MKDKNNNISGELLAAFLDGNVNGDEVQNVLSALNHDNELSEILDLSSRLDAEVDTENRRILPMWALAAANSENLCSFDCETFILQHHHEDSA